MRALLLLPLLLMGAVAVAQSDQQIADEALAVNGLAAWRAESSLRVRLVSARMVDTTPAFETTLAFREKNGRLFADIATYERGVAVRRVIADGATVVAYDLTKRTATWGRYGRDDDAPGPKYRPFFFAILGAAARAQESEAVRVLSLALAPDLAPSGLDWMTKGRYIGASSGGGQLVYRAPGNRELIFATAVPDGVSPVNAGVTYTATRPVGMNTVPIGWTATFAVVPPEEESSFSLLPPSEGSFLWLALPRVVRV